MTLRTWAVSSFFTDFILVVLIAFVSGGKSHVTQIINQPLKQFAFINLVAEPLAVVC